MADSKGKAQEEELRESKTKIYQPRRTNTDMGRRGVCGVMVIVAGNGHGDTSSNPGWDWLHFT